MADPQQPRATEADTQPAAPPPYPGMPRWVKMSGTVVIVVALLIAFILATGVGGNHGPGRHGGGSETSPAAVAGLDTGGGPGSLAPSLRPAAHGALVPRS